MPFEPPSRSGRSDGEGNPFTNLINSFGGSPTALQVDPYIDYDEDTAEIEQILRQFDLNRQNSAEYAAQRIHDVQKSAAREVARLEAAGQWGSSEYERLAHIARTGQIQQDPGALERIGGFIDKLGILGRMAGSNIAIMASGNAGKTRMFDLKDGLAGLLGRQDSIALRHGEDVVGEDGRISGSSQLDRLGWQKTDSFLGNAGRFVASFALETVQDPLSYLSAGGGGLGRGTLNLILKNTIQKAGKEALPEVGEMIVRRALVETGDVGTDQILRMSAKSADDIVQNVSDLSARVLRGEVDDISELDDIYRVAANVPEDDLLPHLRELAAKPARQERLIREALSNPRPSAQIVERSVRSSIDEAAPAILARDWAHQSLQAWQDTKHTQPILQGGLKIGMPFLMADRAVLPTLVSTGIGKGTGRKISRALFGSRPSYRYATGQKGLIPLASAWTDGAWLKPLRLKWEKMAAKWSKESYLRNIVHGNLPASAADQAVNAMAQTTRRIGSRTAHPILAQAIEEAVVLGKNANMSDEQLNGLWRLVGNSIELAEGDSERAMQFIRAGFGGVAEGLEMTDEMASAIARFSDTTIQTFKNAEKVLKDLGVLDQTLDSYLPHILSRDMIEWLQEAVDADVPFDYTSGNIGDQLLAQLVETTDNLKIRAEGETIGSSTHLKSRVIGVTAQTGEGQQILPIRIGDTVLIPKGGDAYAKVASMPVEQLNEELEEALKRAVANGAPDPFKGDEPFFAYNDNPLESIGQYLTDVEQAAVEASMVQALREPGLVTDGIKFVNQQRTAQRIAAAFGEDTTAANRMTEMLEASVGERRAVVEALEGAAHVEMEAIDLGPGLPTIQLPKSVLERSEKLQLALAQVKGKGADADAVARHTMSFMRDTYATLKAAGHSEEAALEMAASASLREIDNIFRDAKSGLIDEMLEDTGLFRETYATVSEVDLVRAKEFAEANGNALSEAVEVLRENRKEIDEALKRAQTTAGFSNLNEEDLLEFADQLEAAQWNQLDEMEQLLSDSSPEQAELLTAIMGANSFAQQGNPDHLAAQIRRLAPAVGAHQEWLTSTQAEHTRWATQFVNSGVGPSPKHINDDWDALQYVSDGGEIFLYHGTGVDEQIRLGGEFSREMGGLSISPHHSIPYTSSGGGKGNVVVFRLSEMPQNVQDHFSAFIAYKQGLPDTSARIGRTGAAGSVDIEDAAALNVLLGDELLPDPVAVIDGKTWSQAIEAVHDVPPNYRMAGGMDPGWDITQSATRKSDFMAGGAVAQRDLRESPLYPEVMASWLDRWGSKMRSPEDLGFNVNRGSIAPWLVGSSQTKMIYDVPVAAFYDLDTVQQVKRFIRKVPGDHAGERAGTVETIGQVQDIIQVSSRRSLLARGVVDSLDVNEEVTVFFPSGTLKGDIVDVSLVPTGSADERAFTVHLDDVLFDHGMLDEGGIPNHMISVRRTGVTREASPAYLEPLLQRPSKGQLARTRPEHLTPARVGNLFAEQIDGDQAWYDLSYRMSVVNERMSVYEPTRQADQQFLLRVSRMVGGLGDDLNIQRRDVGVLERVLGIQQDGQRSADYLRGALTERPIQAALHSEEMRASVTNEVIQAGGPEITWLKGKIDPATNEIVSDAEDAIEVWIPSIVSEKAVPFYSRTQLETRLNEIGETAANLRQQIEAGEVQVEDALKNTLHGLGDDLSVELDTYRVRTDRVRALRGEQVTDVESIMGVKRTRQVGTETIVEAVVSDMRSGARVSGRANTRIVVNPRTGLKYGPSGYVSPLRDSEALIIPTGTSVADMNNQIASFLRHNTSKVERGRTRLLIDGSADGWRVELAVPASSAHEAEMSALALGSRRYVNLATDTITEVAPSRAEVGIAAGRATQAGKALKILDKVEQSLRGGNPEQAAAWLKIDENRAALRSLLTPSELDRLTERADYGALLTNRKILVTQEATRTMRTFFNRMSERETAVQQLLSLSDEVRRMEIEKIGEEGAEQIEWLDEFVEIMGDTMGVGPKTPGGALRAGLYPVDEAGQVTVAASEQYLGRLKTAQRLADRLGFDDWEKTIDNILRNPEFDMKPPSAPSAQHSFRVFGIGGQATEYAFTDAHTANMMKSFMRSWQSLNTPIGFDIFRKEVQYVARAWKGMATVDRPTFHIRNLVGGAWNNQIADVRLQDYAFVQTKMMKLRRLMKKMPFDEALNSFDDKSQRLLMAMHEQGVLDLGFSAAEFNKLRNPIRSQFAAVNPGSENFVLTRGGAFGMRTIEDFLRASAFVRWHDEVGPEAAANIVFDVHFDYTDVGDIDRTIKKIAPFWIWTKNNIPLQMRVLLERPGLISRYFHLMNAFDDSFGQGNDYEAWPNDPYRSGAAADTGVTLNADTPFWAKLIFEPDLPVTDLDILGNPLSMDTWTNALGNTINPAVTAPFNSMQQNEWGTTHAPVGLNELLRITNGIGITGNVQQDGRVQVGIGSANVYSTAFPIIGEYANLLSLNTSPDRRQKLGIVDEDGISLAERLRAAGLTLGRGVGLQATTPGAARSQAAIAQEATYDITDRLKATGALTPLDYDQRGLDADQMEEILRVLYGD